MSKVVILGAGESGVGSAILANQQGFDVFVSDKGKIAQHYKDELNEFDINWEEEKHSEEIILDCNLVIKSPGIPEDTYLLKKIREEQIQVVSEIEFAVQYTDAFIIGITGSNGKTTTTLLTHKILFDSGLDVGLAGNVGFSFARQVALNQHKFYVLELSSFQLDGCYAFSPDIAVLMNITPDHLDRYHNNFNEYVQSKLRIIQNIRKDQKVIYCFDDEVVRSEIVKRQLENKTTLLPFSLDETNEMAGYINKEKFVIDMYNNKMYIDKNSVNLKGRHNQYNTLAATIAARAIELRKESIRESLESFEGVEHRLETCALINDVEYINDSKATNVNSTWYALDSIDNQIIWIAGGVDKGNDYTLLRDLVSEKVTALICLGKNNDKIIQAFGDLITIYETQSIDDAVMKAHQLARKNDTVLLSPACASFDLFKNYVERGIKFKEAVESLTVVE